MRDYFIKGSLNYLNKSNINHNENISRYACECLYIFVEKVLILLILSLFLNFFKEFLIFLIIFGIFRALVGGFHFDDKSLCNLFSISIYLLIPKFVQEFIINDYLKLILVLFALVSVLYYGPYVSKKRPIKIKMREKILSWIVAFIYAFLAYGNFYPQFFFLSLLINSILSNRFLFSPERRVYGNIV